MAIRIKFDNEKRAISPTLVLATRSGRKLGCIPAHNIILRGSLQNGYELSFSVNKYDNWQKAELWDELKDFKLAWSPEWDIWFELYVNIDESTDTVKNVTATSLGEAELSQIMLHNIEINTEIDIERTDYKVTTIYNSKDPEASLLDRIMEKAPHYKLGHVDLSLAKMQRTFSFDNICLRDAFNEIAKELNAIMIIDSGSDENGKIARSVSFYDLEEHCTYCGYRGEQVNGKCPECSRSEWSYGYGEDSGIFVSTENLADDIIYETDSGSVKNCFKLVAGDDLMTAAVAACNPNASSYLWYISDEVRADMSAALRRRLAEYDALYKQVQDSSYGFSGSTVNAYNALATKYGKTPIATTDSFAGLLDIYYNTIDFSLYLEHSLLPDVDPPITTAANQLTKLISEISPVAVMNLNTVSSTTATSYVLAAAKTIVDPRYSVSISNSTLNGTRWSGSFTITRYSDDTDTVTSEVVSVNINDDYESYVLRRINKILNNDKYEDLDIVNLFNKSDAMFVSEIQKYSLVMLKSFYDSCQACLNILIEQGAANESVWAQVYQDLYTQYYARLGYLQSEITVRENEISAIQQMQAEVEKTISDAQARLDFEKFLGETLWLEFAAYRREDTYQNDNYVSDGLDNASLVANAQEFLKTAQEDIERSATLQHSISSSLHNLLVMEEFSGVTDKFELGNWIRIRVDDKVYILRLIDYEIDFDDLTNLRVEYSDVVLSSDSASDIKNVLESAESMATSYGSVSRQAKHGDSSNNQLKSWVTDGLAVTNMRLMSDAVNQNVVWDENGMLFRRWDDITEAYEPTQLRIINSTIAVTDDNWKTVKTAVGGFDYKDPVSGQVKHGYGINAELLIGKLILGEELGLYNENNSLTFDRNGLMISNNINSFVVNPNGNELLALSMKDSQGTDHKLIWVDSKGGLHIVVDDFSLSSGETLQDAIEIAQKAQNLQIILTNEYEGIPTDYTGNYTGTLAVQTGVQTFYGQLDVTNDCTYSVEKSTGVTGSWNSTSKIYTITKLSADSGWVDITATYKSLFRVTKRFNVNKIKAGIPGLTGEQGAPGQDGKDGRTTYFHIKYSDIENPTSASQMTEAPSIYIGTYVDYEETDSTDPAKYTWSRFQGHSGENGIPGTNGSDGKTSYLHIKYSNDGGQSFTSNNGETVGSYIGQYVDFEEQDSPYVNSYKWTKIEGDSARTYFIESTTDVIKSNSDGAITPTSITVSSYYREGTNATKISYPAYFTVLQSTDGVTFTVGAIGGIYTQKQSSITISLPSDMSSDIVALRVCIADTYDGTDSSMLDMKTIPVISDGKDGQDAAEMTQEEIFNKLTNNGQDQGLYMENGQIYINAEYIQSGTITGININGSTLRSELGNGYFWNLYGESQWDAYTMYCEISGGAISGGTFGATYGSNGSGGISFNFPFSENPYNKYFAMGLSNTNAICLDAPQLYVFNHFDNVAGSRVFDRGQSTTVYVYTMDFSTGGYMMVPITFNKGIMVSQV